MDDDEFDRRVGAGEFIEHAGYASHRYGTLRSEVDPRLADGRSVVLEIELQGARQIRETVPDAVQVFIAPPVARRTCAAAWRAAAPTAPSRSRAACEVAEEELEARDEFGHVIENDDVERASRELAELVRSHLAAALPGPRRALS